VSVQSTPRYRQLKEMIIGQISSGELQPSDRVPSENELVDATGVSRMTANRALRELNDEGYVERVAGVGTFVADFKAVSHVLEVRNIADEVALRGHVHSANVLQQKRVLADAKIAAALDIDTGVAVFHIELIHHESGIAIQIEDRFVLAEFAPQVLEQDFSAVTPSAYLSSISPLQEAEHVVRAEMPAENIREHLEMGAQEPCLVVTRRTWAHGRPVSFANLYHPGSRFELSGHYVPPGTEAQVKRRLSGANTND
jgi:GntR family histidine utilization transcriptional repressor